MAGIDNQLIARRLYPMYTQEVARSYGGGFLRLTGKHEREETV